MTIYIGADHGGFKLKEALKPFLETRGYEVKDLGAHEFDAEDDYPKLASAVAQIVKEDKTGESLGILLCRTGQGVCIVANKFDDIRAIIAWNPEAASRGRHDDYANVLCSPSDFIDLPTAEHICEAFLDATPGEDERFIRRLNEITNLENS